MTTSGHIRLSEGTAPPAAPGEGVIYFDSNDGQLYVIDAAGNTVGPIDGSGGGGGAPSGAASGDLGASYPNPLVVGLQGNPVSDAIPNVGTVLSWTGTEWAPGAIAATGISELTGDVTAGPGSGSQAATVVALQGLPVSASNPAPGYALIWDGTEWVPTAPTDTGITEITGDVTVGPGSGSQAGTVVALQGQPVSVSAPAAGEALIWDGTEWVPTAPTDTGITEITGDVTVGPGSGSQAGTVVALQGQPVSTTAPSAGEALIWDGTEWVPTAPTDTGITEITGDVTAGPGNGSQAATVAAIQGTPVSATPPTVVGEVLTWDGSAWAPAAAATSFGGFAPKYLVGNTDSGDPDTSSVAGVPAGFHYFPDPGDGTGIIDALLAAAAVPGDVLIRPGIYNVSSTLTVPSGVEVRGSGVNSTFITSVDDAVSGALFSLGNGAKLRSLTCQHDRPGDVGIPTEGNGVVEVKNASATCEDVAVTSSWASPDNSTLRGCFYAFGSGGTLGSLTLVRCSAEYKNNNGGSYLNNLVGFRGRDAALNMVDCEATALASGVTGYSVVVGSSEAANKISIRGGMFTARYGSVYIFGSQAGSVATFTDMVVRAGLDSTAGPVGIGVAGYWDAGIHNCDINMESGTASPCVGFYPSAGNEQRNTARVIGCNLTGAAANYPWYSQSFSGVSGYHTILANTYSSSMTAPVTGVNDETAHNIGIP